MAISVSVQDVRDNSGAPSSLIGDSTITNLISQITKKTKNLYDVNFDPTKKVETLTGDFKRKIMLDEYFPLKVLKLQNANSSVDLTNIFVNTREGTIEYFGDNASVTQVNGYGAVFSGYAKDVSIKYLYGAVERDTDVQTESTASFSSGTSVTISVDDETGFSDNDYVFLEDTNEKYEVAKVTSIASGQITVDKLNNSFEDETLITKAKTMDIFNDFVLYEVCIAVALRAIGSTYTFNTNYNLGSLSVNKGVPFSHWERSFRANIQLRDQMKQRIDNILGVIV